VALEYLREPVLCPSRHDLLIGGGDGLYRRRDRRGGAGGKEERKIGFGIFGAPVRSL
jgi:hypothetical protein